VEIIGRWHTTNPCAQRGGGHETFERVPGRPDQRQSLSRIEDLNRRGGGLSTKRYREKERDKKTSHGGRRWKKGR